MNDMITQTDTIHSIVSRFPALKKTLVEISPRFERLNNTLLFNTVAKLTTVEKASRMGNVYLNEMLYQLNEAIGKGDEFLQEVKARGAAAQGRLLQERFGASPQKPRPGWMDRSTGFEVVDVRGNPGEPFFEVVKKASALKPGEGLVLRQKFEPTPLIRHHEQLGFETFTEQKADDDFAVYFFRPGPPEKQEQ